MMQMNKSINTHIRRVLSSRYPYATVYLQLVRTLTEITLRSASTKLKLHFCTELWKPSKRIVSIYDLYKEHRFQRVCRVLVN